MTSYKTPYLTVMVLVVSCILASCNATTSSMKRAPLIDDAASSAQSADGITIRAPDFVENPNVVPVSVQLDNDIGENDVLELLVNGKVAYRIKPQGGARVNFFSGRVRLVDGLLEARILKGGKQDRYESRSVRQSQKAYVPDLADNNTEYRDAWVGGSYKAIFKNFMGAKGYIENIAIDTNQGAINVEMTPWCSMNPFLWLKGNFQTAAIRGVNLSTSGGITAEGIDPDMRPSDGEVKSVSTGTGWFSTYGVFVTNHHVVDGARQIFVIADGTTVPVQVVQSDNVNDIVLLKPKDAKDAIGLRGITIASSPARLGEAVFTIGYPIASELGVSPKLTDGVISSTSGLHDAPSQYQISIPIQPGNSGGPLLNMKGEVIGITTSSINPAYMLDKSGVLPQNVNYAVKSEYIIPLLSAARLHRNVPEINFAGHDLASVADGVRNSIFIVVASP